MIDKLYQLLQPFWNTLAKLYQLLATFLKSDWHIVSTTGNRFEIWLTQLLNQNQILLILTFTVQALYRDILWTTRPTTTLTMKTGWNNNIVQSYYSTAVHYTVYIYNTMSLTKTCLAFSEAKKNIKLSRVIWPSGRYSRGTTAETTGTLRGRTAGNIAIRGGHSHFFMLCHAFAL